MAVRPSIPKFILRAPRAYCLKSLDFLSNILVDRHPNNRLYKKLLLKIDYFSAMTRVTEMVGGGEIKPAAASRGGDDDATLHGIAGVVRGVLAAECGGGAGYSQAVVLCIRNRGQLRARHQALGRRRERRSERRGEDRGVSERCARQGAAGTAAAHT